MAYGEALGFLAVGFMLGAVSVIVFAWYFDDERHDDEKRS
jgi:nitrogen fixation-related uncharacterized protein